MKCTTPGSHQKKIRLNSVNSTFASKQKKVSIHRSSLNGNLRVFQDHRKQAKINVAFHHFPLLGLNEPPRF